MKSKSIIGIDPTTGEINRFTMHIERFSVNEALLKDMIAQQQTFISVPGLFKVGDGYLVNGSFDSKGGAILTTMLPYIEINSRFAVVKGDGGKNTLVLTPRSRSDEGRSDEGRINQGGNMTLRWMVPEGMQLRLMASFNAAKAILDVWMFASQVKSPGVYYRLPLPNHYEDCRLCLGTGWQTSYSTLQEQMQAVVTQLFKSSWNSDLESISGDNTERVFRWEEDGTTYRSLCPAQWTRNCNKVAVGVTARIV